MPPRNSSLRLARSYSSKFGPTSVLCRHRVPIHRICTCLHACARTHSCLRWVPSTYHDLDVVQPLHPVVRLPVLVLHYSTVVPTAAVDSTVGLFVSRILLSRRAYIFWIQIKARSSQRMEQNQVVGTKAAAFGPDNRAQVRACVHDDRGGGSVGFGWRVTITIETRGNQSCIFDLKNRHPRRSGTIYLALPVPYLFVRSNMRYAFCVASAYRSLSTIQSL